MKAFEEENLALLKRLGIIEDHETTYDSKGVPSWLEKL